MSREVSEVLFHAVTEGAIQMRQSWQAFVPSSLVEATASALSAEAYNSTFTPSSLHTLTLTGSFFHNTSCLSRLTVDRQLEV